MNPRTTKQSRDNTANKFCCNNSGLLRPTAAGLAMTDSYQHMKFREIKIKNKESGFTLLEVIVGIYIILMGLGGSLSLITYVLANSSASVNRVIAANLAQEGIEIVRNMRDLTSDTGGQPGWVYWFSCNCGPPDGDWRAQYDDTGNLAIDWDRYLLFDASAGLYQYQTGTETPFKRKIHVQRLASGVEAIVTSEVSWTEKGRAYLVKADSRLWNWR